MKLLLLLVSTTSLATLLAQAGTVKRSALYDCLDGCTFGDFCRAPFEEWTMPGDTACVKYICRGDPNGGKALGIAAVTCADMQPPKGKEREYTKLSGAAGSAYPACCSYYQHNTNTKH